MSNGRLRTTVVWVACATLVACASAAHAARSFLPDTDLPGHDFRNFALHRDFDMARPGEVEGYQRQLQSHFEELARECRQACERDSECSAWTLKKERDQSRGAGGLLATPWRVNGRCFLKTEAPPPIRDHTCISGTLDRRVPTAEAAPRLAPGLEARTDRPGGDYREVPRASWEGAESCQQLCQHDAQCSAWTWVRGGIQGPNPRCYLKNTVPNPVQNECCISGVKTGGRPVPPPPSSGERLQPVERTQRTPTLVPAQDMRDVPIAYGWELNTNRPGADYRHERLEIGTDAGACLQLCQRDGRCQAWTWLRPGVKGDTAVCYLKDGVPAPVADEYCVSGVK
jgi:hypothetical protein